MAYALAAAVKRCYVLVTRCSICQDASTKKARATAQKENESEFWILALARDCLEEGSTWTAIRRGGLSESLSLEL